MFTFYQNINARREEAELAREAELTGHDRFCQMRPGAAATRRKRRGPANHRTHSAIEIECNNDAFASVRSVLLTRKEKSASVEEDEPPSSASLLQHQPDDDSAAQESSRPSYYHFTSKIDSLAKILFSRVYAVKGNGSSSSGANSSSKDNRQSADPTRFLLRF